MEMKKDKENKWDSIEWQGRILDNSFIQVYWIASLNGATYGDCIIFWESSPCKEAFEQVMEVIIEESQLTLDKLKKEIEENEQIKRNRS